MKIVRTSLGDIESWRGPRRGDPRIMKDVYPPRIEAGS